MREEERERPVRKEHVREEGEECEGGGRREKHVREEGEVH